MVRADTHSVEVLDILNRRSSYSVNEKYAYISSKLLYFSWASQIVIAALLHNYEIMHSIERL